MHAKSYIYIPLLTYLQELPLLLVQHDWGMESSSYNNSCAMSECKYLNGYMSDSSKPGAGEEGRTEICTTYN